MANARAAQPLHPLPLPQAMKGSWNKTTGTSLLARSGGPSSPATSGASANSPGATRSPRPSDVRSVIEGDSGADDETHKVWDRSKDAHFLSFCFSCALLRVRARLTLAGAAGVL